MTLRMNLSSIALLAAVAACNGTGTPPGSAGGACRQLGGVPCDPGLTCEGGLCVGPGGGAGGGGGPDGGDGVSQPPGYPDSGITIGSDAAPPFSYPDASTPVTGCDPVYQSGCGVSEHCTVISDGVSGGTSTCYADGSLGLGAVCTFTTNQPDNCQGAAGCIGDRCRQHCDGSFGCSSGQCVPLADNYSYCLPSCNVLTQGCSASEESCYVVSGAGQEACAYAGTLAKGASCQYINQCARGLACDPAAAVCRSYCDATTYPNTLDPGHCVTGEICVPTSYQPAVGFCTPSN